MTIEIDATWGGATANAYSTLDAATAYLATHPLHAIWEAAIGDGEDEENDDPAIALIHAARQIDGAQNWRGVKLNGSAQALAFPRGIVLARNAAIASIRDVPVPRALSAPGGAAASSWLRRTTATVELFDGETDEEQQAALARANAEQALSVLRMMSSAGADMHAVRREAGIVSASSSAGGVSTGIQYDGRGFRLCEGAALIMRKYIGMTRVVRGDSLGG